MFKKNYDGTVPDTVFLTPNWLPLVSTAHATTDMAAAADKLCATESVPTAVDTSDPPFIVYLTCVILVPESCWTVNTIFDDVNEIPVTLGIFLSVPVVVFTRTIPEPPLPALLVPLFTCPHAPPPPPVCF